MPRAADRVDVLRHHGRDGVIGLRLPAKRATAVLDRTLAKSRRKLRTRLPWRERRLAKGSGGPP